MQIDCKIIYGNNINSNVSHTKFLVLAIDSTLSSSTHIEGTVNKLSSVLYMFRSAKPYISHSSLITIYYALFHSSMSHGIIFWGNSYNKQKIFKLQKRAIRIIIGSRNKDSCRNLFKLLAVLPLKSEYIFLFFYLWWRTGINLQPSMTVIIYQRDKVKIFIFCLPPYPYTNRVLTTQV